MLEQDRNRALIAEVYRRWHKSKGAALDDLINIFADNVRFGSLAEGAGPLAFTSRSIGIAEVRGYFDNLLSQWSMIHYTVDFILAEDDRVAVVGSTAWANKLTGKTLETPKVDVWRFRDGRAIEFYEYYDTARAIAAAT